MLATFLGVTLLDVPLCADLYAGNGFRLLGLPASAERKVVVAALQRVRTMARVRRSSVLVNAIPLGYDELLDEQRLVEALPKMTEPRVRLLCETFWPHLDNVVAAMRNQGHVAAPNVLAEIETSAGRPGLEGILATHARAVVAHNRALAMEARATSTNLTDVWQIAFRNWVHVSGCDEFWQYLEKRVAALDDPRIAASDVHSVRDRLGALLLAFHQVFAIGYDRSGEPAACQRHVDLLVRGSEVVPGAEAARRATLQPIAERRLDGIVQQAAEMVGRKTKSTRAEAAQLVDGARRTVSELHEFFDGASASNGQTLFDCDRLARTVLQCVNRAIDYSGAERWRNLLFSMVTARQLSEWPLSPVARREMEQSAQSDEKLLYGQQKLSIPSGTDVSRCWFLPSQWADPEASLLIRQHHIDKVTPMSISWSKVVIVIPRSKAAQAVHDGKPLPAEAAPIALVRKVEACAERTREIEKEAGALFERDAAPIRAARDAAIESHRLLAAPNVQVDEFALAEIERQRCVLREEEDRRFEGEATQSVARFRERERSLEAQASKRHSAKDPVMLGVVSPVVAASGLSIGTAVSQWEAYHPMATSDFLLWGAILLSVGAWLTWLLQKAIRRLRVAPILAQQQALRAAHQREVATLDAERGRKHAAIDAAAAAEASAPRARLEEAKAASARLTAPFDAQEAEVFEQHGQPVAKARAELAKLQREVEQSAKVKPRGESSNFPACKSAKSQGFRDGEQPDPANSQRQMTSAFERFVARLSQADKYQLMLAQKRMDKETFAKLVEAMAEKLHI
jgi:hypothetical protein